MKNKIIFWLGSLEHIIDSLYLDECSCNEGSITESEYNRIKYLIRLIREEINMKRGDK